MGEVGWRRWGWVWSDKVPTGRHVLWNPHSHPHPKARGELKGRQGQQEGRGKLLLV